MNIPDQLRKAIRESGMTPYKVAKLAGVPQSTLSRFLHGERTITLTVFDRLAKTLGLELHQPEKPKAD